MFSSHVTCALAQAGLATAFSVRKTKLDTKLAKPEEKPAERGEHIDGVLSECDRLHRESDCLRSNTGFMGDTRDSL